MYNTIAQLRELYFQQSRYSAEPAKAYYPPLLQWPSNSYFERFKPDSDLLQNAISLADKSYTSSVANQIFGSQKEQEYLGLKHSSNLFYERCKLHKQHLEEINHRHIQAQEKLFCVKINNFPDKAKRQSALESQLLQLEQQRRDEELTFWKDTAEIREKLFEGAAAYRVARQRYSIFSDVEGKYGR